MRKKLLLPIVAFIALAMLLAFGACSTEELLQDPNSGTTPRDARTVTLTASMPQEPTTRVGLEQKADKTISLTWEVGDKLQLAFVQDAIKVKQTITLTAENITNEGKKAVFDIELPALSTGFKDNVNFDLYGVCGGGKKKLGFDLGMPEGGATGGGGTLTMFYTGDALELGDAGTNPYIKLPTYAGSAQSLETVHFRKDVMLTFTSTNIDATNPRVSVMFNHLGSLFNITLKNTGTTSLENLDEAQLVGINNPDNQNWAYNAGTGGKTYDLVTGKFLDTDDAGNYISLRAATSTLEAGATTTFWAWYPPLPDKDKVWPELQLQLKDGTTPEATTLAISVNSKPARTGATAAGKAYYFYSSWDGAELYFTNDLYTYEYTVNVPTRGSLNSILSAAQKANISKLTVTGEINKDDFYVMKKDMPKLTCIDLSEVTPYEGTIENKIPTGALGWIDYKDKANEKITTIILPNSITSIGSYAFARCKGLRGTLTIPDMVTTIGSYAFSDCTGLTGELTIPSGVIAIEEKTFNNCTGFTGSLTLPNELITIGSYAFSDCNGLSGTLTIPSKVTTIEKYAFKKCSGFTGSLVIPNKVTTIEDRAFWDCVGFTGTLTLSDELITLGSAFVGCKGFTGSLTLPDKLETIGNSAFERCNFTGSLTIPDKVTTIGGAAFAIGAFTGTLNLPAGLITIGDLAFSECRGFIGSLNIPNKVTSIGSNAFKECAGFTGTLTISDKVISIGYAAFKDCTGFTGSLILPEGLVLIDNEVFKNCSGLTGPLTIPSNVTSIGRYSFQNCNGFNGSLSLPNGLIKIDFYAFKDCTGFIGTLTLPNDLKTIGNCAFENCQFNGRLTVSENVTSIGTLAFHGWTNIESFKFSHTTQPIKYTTNMLQPEVPIQVPSNLVNTYKSTSGWSNHGDHIVAIPD